MNSIKKTLLFLICLFYVQASFAVVPIQIEVKVFGKEVIFVLYRDKDQIIDFTPSSSSVIANINVPSDFKLKNPKTFNKYAKGLRSTANKQRIIFEVNEELQYQSVINGEKLDAIKYRTTKKPKEKKEDLSKLSSAKNDPGIVKYEKDKDQNQHKLQFNLGNNESGVASFFRGKYLWIVFDQKKLFSFEEGGIFSEFELVPSQEGTVIRMKVDQEFTKAQVEKVEYGWSINVSKRDNQNWLKQNILTPEPIPDTDGFLIRGDFEDNKVISFEDPELGDIISAVPLITKGARVYSKLDSIEFSLLKSIQGIGVVFYSDDVVMEKYKDAVRVISDTALPEDISSQASTIFTQDIDDYLNLPTILPYKDKKLDILNFIEQKARIIREASEDIDKTSAFERNFALAKLYFINGWYHETVDSLNLAKQLSQADYQGHFQARFLKAVAHSLIGEHRRAKEEYDDLLSYSDLNQIAELVVWNNYNEFALAANTKHIGAVNHLSSFMEFYTDDKYWPLVTADIELALLANDLKLVEKIFREVRAPSKDKYANNLKFYKAEYYKKKKQLNLAKQYYRDLVYQDHDIFNKVRAEFALTKMRKEAGEINSSVAAEILERLRFEWRGDQLEYEILLQLALYYRDMKDIMSSLRIYKYTQDAFSNKISNFYITSEMARIFNDVFLPGGLAEEMDDFTAIALFYEFKELNPIGEQGDDVIISIAKRLVKLDLLENASDLLRHQVNYRLKGEKRVDIADYLAVILMMDKKPDEAMLILDSTDKDNFDFNKHEYRVRLRAEALIDLEEYDKALLYLKKDQSNDATILKKEAIFKAQRWNVYADMISLEFDDIIQKVGTDASAAQDVLRLAISYYMLNLHDQLVMISQEIGDRNAKLRNIVDLLISSSGSVDYKNLDQSLNIDQMQMLLNKYKNQFLKSY